MLCERCQKQSLEHGEAPDSETCFTALHWKAVEPGRLPESAAWLERIIARCFKLRSQLPNPEGDHGRFALTLTQMLLSLWQVDRSRFTAMLEALKAQCGEASRDARRKLLWHVEKQFWRRRKGGFRILHESRCCIH